MGKKIIEQKRIKNKLPEKWKQDSHNSTEKKQQWKK